MYERDLIKPNIAYFRICITNMIRNLFQNVFFLLVVKYLVATGYPSSSGVKIEIVDLSDPTKSCILEDISWRYHSAGGLLGTTPVICGGINGGGIENYLNDCIFYGTSQVISMSTKRAYTSSVVLDNNKLWMLGGYGYNRLASTEFITTAGAVNGPTLPEAIDRPCVVKFPDNGFIYLIGGDTGSSTSKSSSQTNNVWVANPSNLFGGFTQGRGGSGQFLLIRVGFRVF